MATIRAAIIGAGGVASSQHAPGLARLQDVKIVGVCDLDGDRAAQLANKYGAQSYTDYHKMLEELKPDIVHVCTPEAFHFEPVMASLAAGAHVFCEKVMAETNEKARAMVAEALKRDRFLAVDYNYRFIPAFAELKKLIDNGELGEIALVNAYAHSYCMHHTIDLLRFLVGEIVEIAAMHTRWNRRQGALPLPVGELVYCPTRNEGVVLRFENGAVATLSGSLYMDLAENMVQLEVVGDKGRATVKNVRIHDISGNLVVEPGGRDIPLCTEEERKKGFDLAFERSIAAFVESVRRNQPPSPSGIDGLRAVEVEEAVVRSQKERRFIPLPRVACGSLAFSKLPLEEALTRIARLGIPYVDLAVQEGWAHLNPSEIAADVDAAVERLQNALSQTGLQVISLNVGLGTNDPAEETRRMAAVAQLAKTVGARTITLPGSAQGTPVDDEIQRLGRLVEAAKPFGVAVTLETHVGQISEDPQTVLHVVNAVPGLALTLDPSHYYAGPTQGQGFDEVFRAVRHVHLRDAGLSWDEIQMPVGAGKVDFDKVFAQLNAHGYTGDFVIEYIDSIGSLDTPREIVAMKNLVDQYY